MKRVFKRISVRLGETRRGGGSCAGRGGGRETRRDWEKLGGMGEVGGVGEVGCEPHGQGVE